MVDAFVVAGDEDEVVSGGEVLGGGLAGLAGMMEVAGPIGQLVPQVSPGYGFTAIIVAFVGRRSVQCSSSELKHLRWCSRVSALGVQSQEVVS